MSLTQQQEADLKILLRRTVENAFSRLGNLTLSRQAINPFLAVFVARRPRELAEFIVHQRVERGLVTSFGMQLQKIVTIVGANIHPSGVEGADFERRDETVKRHTVMQLKSGPETINSDIARQIRANLNSAERRIRMGGLSAEWTVVKMLGMIYGTPEHRNSWVLGTGAQGFDVDKIGRTFWEFVSGEEDMHLDVFRVALEVARDYRDPQGRTLPEAIQDAISSLTSELRTHYSDAQGDLVWSRLLEENM